MKRLSYTTLFIMVLLCSCTHNTRLWRVQKNGLYGFIDSLGNIVIEPQYRYVGHFCNGYACVVSNMSMTRDSILYIKYGYINTDNELVIDTTNEISINANNISGVSSFESKFIKKSFGFRDYILRNLNLCNDRFVFQDLRTKYYGYKDSEGNVVIEPKYYMANSFSNGKAIIIDTLKSKDYQNDLTSLLNKTGAIDVNGKIIITPKYSYIADYAENGQTWACYINKENNSNDYVRQWVLLGEKGNTILPPIIAGHVYNNASGGPYVVEFNLLSSTFYSFMDNKGKYLSDYNHDKELNLGFTKAERMEFFKNVTAFSDSYAGVEGEFRGHPAWFLVNKKIDSNYTPYDSVLCFSEGLIAVKEFVINETYSGLRSGKWGYIDKYAHFKIPYKFSECGSFGGGLAYFKNYGSTYDIEGYINKKGNVIWQTRCKKI